MIKEFKTYDDFKKYLKNYRLVEIGSGGEGVACYSPVTKECIKLIDEDADNQYFSDQVITEDDIKLPNILFPKDVYDVDGFVRGYSTRFFYNDILNSDYYGFEKKVDSDKLLNSIHILHKDIDELTKNNIKMFDLFSNLVFDGERLCAIDTLTYRYSNSKDLEKFNREMLYYALNTDLNRRMDDYNYDLESSIYDNIKDYVKKKNNKILVLR